VIVWGHGHRHHTKVGATDEGGKQEEYAPQNFNKGPLKTNHSIHYNAIDYRLYKNIGELNYNLQCKRIIKEHR